MELTREKMTVSELMRAEKALKDLSEGAGAFQIKKLPPLISENARSAYENGALLTDTIATWVKKGFVAGPFDTPQWRGSEPTR